MNKDTRMGRLTMLFVAMAAAAVTFACDASVECGQSTEVSDPDTTITSKGDTTVTSGDSTVTEHCKGEVGVEVKPPVK